MVLGLFIVTAIPTVTGVCQAVSAQKNRDQREKDERRMKKFHIDVECIDTVTDSTSSSFDGGRIVLKHDRLFIGPAGVTEEAQGKRVHGYVAEAFYIEYPDSEVANNPPLLNWIYVDKDTMELKYGNKSASISHHVGSWDWTANDETYITFERLNGKQAENFIAVQHSVDKGVGKWQIYCDLGQNGLDGYVGPGCKKVKIRLKRMLMSNET